MIITNTNNMHIPKGYEEGDSYDSIQLVMQPYSRTSKRAINRLRQGNTCIK